MCILYCINIEGQCLGCLIHCNLIPYQDTGIVVYHGNIQFSEVIPETSKPANHWIVG